MQRTRPRELPRLGEKCTAAGHESRAKIPPLDSEARAMQEQSGEESERLETFDYAFIEAVLWMRGVRGRPTLEEFAKAVAVLAEYSAAHSLAPPPFNA